jgi:isopentenyl diphosphate isomerase/L-lactate dehydrogenase-like FMN-dependent dehydrogenase
MDCLPGVVAAARNVPVLFNSGVRLGADVVKAWHWAYRRLELTRRTPTG